MTYQRPNTQDIELLILANEQANDLNQPALHWWIEPSNDDDLAKHYDRLAASKGISFTQSYIGA